MNEVRLTVSGGDFGAVSQALVDMGIGFRVEPVAATAAEAKRVTLPTVARTRTAGKRSGKTAKRNTKSDSSSTAGAERLRDAIARALPGAEQNPPAPAQPSYLNTPAAAPHDDPG